MSEWMGNLYEVLGVEPSASKKEIEKAYKELAFHYHPDRNPTRIADELLKKINEAYTVLRDPGRRREYDAEHGFNQEDRVVAQADFEPTPAPSSEPDSGKKFSVGHAVVCVVFGFILGGLVHPAVGVAACILMFFSSRIFGLAITAAGVAVVGVLAIGFIVYISEKKSDLRDFDTYPSASGQGAALKLDSGLPVRPVSLQEKIIHKCPFLSRAHVHCQGDLKIPLLTHWNQILTDRKTGAAVGCMQFCGEYGTGLRHGPAIAWNLSGQKTIEGRYRLGKPYGTWTYRGQDGRVLKRERYGKNGALLPTARPKKRRGRRGRGPIRGKKKRRGPETNAKWKDPFKEPVKPPSSEMESPYIDPFGDAP